MLSRAASALAMFGVEPRRAVASLRGLAPYLRNRRRFRALDTANDFPFAKPYPCLADRYAQAGTGMGVYFSMDLHVARLVHRANPARHVDVGSRIDGFIAHLAAFRDVDVIDIRPLDVGFPNIRFHQLDLMQGPGPFENSCESLSCLHVLEHFGLGRYGDPIDPDGHLKGWNHLTAMLTTNGRFYFAVPIGRQRIEFDAHRVIADRFDINSFAYIDDARTLHTDADPRSTAARDSFRCRWGCGIFELTKR
jgi:hypothetical protein